MMSMNAKALLSALLTSAAIGAAPPPAPPALEKVEVRQLQMGVMATLTVFAHDADAARAACGRAFARVLELNSVLSDYDPTSELRQLIAQAGRGPQPASPDLLLVLGHARTVAEQTAGQLDPTVGPLVQLWREARRARTLPDPAALAAARALTGFAHLQINAANRTIALDRPGMKLDLGAVAKGYAGDEALRVLREAGYPVAMFEAGGDLVFGDPPPGAAGWPVELPWTNQPLRHLANCALSVSGDTVQYVEIGGRRYSHVVDPSTGCGLTNRLLCVVQAPRGLISDPLSTAGTLMPEAEFRALLARHYPDVQAWVEPAPAQTARP